MVVATLQDAFEILRVVVQHKEWKVKKLDIEKLLQPKQFGWRFLGADLLVQGQLVECYIGTYMCLQRAWCVRINCMYACSVSRARGTQKMRT